MRPLTLVLVTTAVALGACGSGSSDKAGGDSDPKVTTLSFANGNSESTNLQPFADAVERLSEGTLRISFEDGWRGGRPDYEAGLIRDVQAGEADLGWAGSRAFGDVGVRAFDALHAPLLIDSYELEQAVLESGLPQQMLAALDPLRLVGIGILPGPMRKPLGVSALVAPADFADREIALQRSRVGSQTLRALGARAVEISPGAAIDEYDGIEQQVDSIAANGYDEHAASLTANVNLWPRPPVVFANAASFAELDDRQRRALRDAIDVALEPTLALERAADSEGATALCGRDVQFTEATDAELAGLRRALRPVYDRLLEHAPTKAAIAEIREHAARLDAPPDVAACSAPGSAPAAAATAIDGTYELETTREEVARVIGAPASELDSENYGRWRFVLSRGRMRYTQASEGAERWQTATYVVRGNRFTFRITDHGGETPNNAPERKGEVFDFAWSLDRGRLTLKPVEGKISPEPFLAKAWRHVD